MSDQIVLKLSVPQERQGQVLRHPLLRKAGARARERLVSIYYDTDRLLLHRAGILLCLRKRGGGWMQTVKRQAPSLAGLTRRAEWERAYDGHFDFSGIDDGELRRRIAKRKLRQRLQPVFETSFHRVTWLLQPAPDVAILVMLDRGWIAA